jgi:hypothetical protein
VFSKTQLVAVLLFDLLFPNHCQDIPRRALSSISSMKASEFLDREIAVVHNQVSDLQTRLRRLQARGNALVPFCRLPIEILVRIMDILAAPTSDAPQTPADKEEKTEEKGGGLAGWTHVMGTCTRMRSLVLNTPRLWAEVDLTRNAEWVKLCMERSASCPLIVTFDEDLVPWLGCECEMGERPKFSEERSAFLEEHFKSTLPRASSVNIHLPNHYELAPSIDEVLCRTAFPHLRSLTYLVDEAYDQDPTLDISREFLGGASALTQLILGGMEISVCDLSLPSLIRLELRHVEIIEGPVALARFVAQTPLLRDLRLEVNFQHTPSHPSILPIHLPHLRTLHIRTDSAVCLAYLRAFSVPKDELHADARSRSFPDPASLQEEFLSYIWDMLDLDGNTPMIKIGCADNDHRPHSVSLEIAHPGKCIPYVRYQSTTSLPNLQAILNRVRAIHITPGKTLSLYQLITPTQLRACEHVIIDTAGTHMDHNLLRSWLRARVDAGHRVRVLDLRGCSKGCARCHNGQEEMQRILVLATQLNDERLVDEVFVDGVKTRT